MEVLSCNFGLEELVEANPQEDCINEFSQFIHVKESTIGDKEVISEAKYIIDNCGKVHSENFHNPDYIDESYDSDFRYDKEGRVIKEFRNNIIYRYVQWIDNRAKVYDRLGNKINEFVFENDKIIQFISSYPNSNTVTYTLEYDNSGNLMSIEDNILKVPYEYLDFSDEIENPFYLLNSISVLRFDLRPFMRFIHGVEKRNEHIILDVYYSTKKFDISYQLDTEDRVIGLQNTKFFRVNSFKYE